MPTERAQTLAKACALISQGDTTAARACVNREYPFEPVASIERKYGMAEAIRVFVRDGFVDRYSGARLVFPGALRICSLMMPDAFPFHPNWRMSETHEAYWELSPTIDHVVPIARGGIDAASNWVTTSMRRNSAKSNWTLEELGWKLHPPGNFEEWDGLLGWFQNHVRANPDLLQNSFIRRWSHATKAVGTG